MYLLLLKSTHLLVHIILHYNYYYYTHLQHYFLLIIKVNEMLQYVCHVHPPVASKVLKMSRCLVPCDNSSLDVKPKKITLETPVKFQVQS